MNSSHTVVSAYLRERIPFGTIDGKAIARFAEKIEVLDNGCWRWTAAANSSGYGRFQYQGRYPMAHRWAWEAVNGPVPVGLVLDHYRYPRGHPFDRRTSRGWRVCSICRDAYMRAYRATRKTLAGAAA